MAETKTVLVPEGLSGERIDTALARLLGLSRSRAADLAGAGQVLLNSVVVAKAAKVVEGDLLEVTIPAPEGGAARHTLGIPGPGVGVGG